MSRYQQRSTASLIAIFIVVAIVIAGAISAARALFFSGDGSNQIIDRSQTVLLDTTGNNSVSMQLRGPIVAQENHVGYRLTVSPTSRTLTVYRGYNGEVVDSVVLSNTKEAYEQFVFALNRADYSKGSELTGERNDTRGICSSGRVFYFSINENLKPVKTLWTTSCRENGSFKGDLNVTRSLFVNQFTDNARAIINQLPV